MSKTLASVLEVAAVIGLQFTGIGGVVADVIGLTGAAAASQGLLIATIALTAAEAGLNAAIFSSPRPPATDSAIKASLPERVRGYGITGLEASIDYL